MLETSKENYSNYLSHYLFRTLIPVFVIPFLIPLTLHHLRVFTCNNWFIFISLQLLSVIVYNAIRIQAEDYLQHREAKRLGAQLVPRYRGKWLGNADFIWTQIQVSKEGDMGAFLTQILNEYKTTTINLRVLWADVILTCDEGLVKLMLATSFEQFDKGWRAKQMMETMLGNGIFNRDGETWKFHRGLTRPFFARERIADFETFEKHTSKALERIEALGTTPFDAQDLFGRFTLDTGGTFLFNTELDTLSLPLPKAFEAKLGSKGSAVEGNFGAFATAFEQCQQIIVDRSRTDSIWPLFEIFVNKCDKHMEVIKNWLDPIVKATLEANQERKQNGGEDVKNDIENCSFLEYMAANTEDVELIRQELLNILLAARDTTASLLTFVIYELAMRPDYMARLRTEILGICPEQEMPTYERLREMKYLRAVLNETLRKWPPVPGNSRATKSSPCVFTPSSSNVNGDQRPYYIPPDKDISYVPWIIHRRTDLWGDDADAFDPDRWLDHRLERMIKNPLMFVPFNAGPRICIGQQFALNEASFFLVRLFQRYSSFELASECQPEGSFPPEAARGKDGKEKIWAQAAITIFAKGGLWVRAQRAQ